MNQEIRVHFLEPRGQRPNMRLQLPGALALIEAIGSCPGRHEPSSTTSCAGERVARSLRAIR